jgi:hypothetical protein
MRLPVYYITIDDEFSDGGELGWTETALVSSPAILRKGIAFSENQKTNLTFKDSLKYRIAAPAMIPDEKIYRKDEETGEEYYVVFTKNEIEKIYTKFMKNFGKNKDLFNLEHDSEKKVPAFLLESWLVSSDPNKDKSYSEFGIKVPAGSLFLVAQITDKEYYEQLIQEEQTGFSIEGYFELYIQNTINNNKNKFKEQKMEKLILPEGSKFEVDGKWYIVENGAIIEYQKEAEVEMAEEVKEEIKEEEKVEMQEEIVTEEVTEELPLETYTKAEIDAKFDELYKLIADMSVAKAEEVEVELGEEKPKSIEQKFAAFIRASK